MRRKAAISPSKASIALPVPADLRISTVCDEFQALGLIAQEMGIAAAQANHSGASLTYNTTCGIMTDRWLDMQGLSDLPAQRISLHCACHVREDKGRARLMDWLSRALLCVRQLKAALAESPVKLQDVIRWSNACNIAGQKIVRYHELAAATAPNLIVMSAHRHQIPALMEKFAIAARVLGLHRQKGYLQ